MDRPVKNIFFVTIFFCTSVSAIFAQQETATADSLLVKQIEEQMQAAAPPPSAPRSAPTTNPDISAIGDFRMASTNIGQRNVEMYFNQLEMQVTSVVDPYARANFLFSFGKDSLNGGFGAGLEEATLTSIDLPYQLQVTVGKFKPHFTKVNSLHPHAFSFVDFPLFVGRFFSDEGLFMEGISASWLVPNPYDFYQELTIEAGRSEANSALDSGNKNRLLYIGHLKNFFDLTDNATLEFGLSGLSGVNTLQLPTSMGGIDLTYKWKPVQFNTVQSFTWQTEALLSDAHLTPSQSVRSYGGYTMMEYQIEKRSFIGGRYDYSAAPGDYRSEVRSASLLVRFQPTEFQILALEFQHSNFSTSPVENKIVFRAIFGIGTHAAHAY
jgi:hypothetical protein